MRYFPQMAVLFILLSPVPMVSADGPSEEQAARNNRVVDDVEEQTMERDHFIMNLGQLSRDDIRFYSMGGLRAGFTDSSVVFALGMERSYSYEVEFIGSNDVEPQGIREAPTKYNFFQGRDRDSWVTDAGSFEEVIYEDLWDDMDLIFYCKDEELKYDLIAAPGADISKISFRVIGADISASSDLTTLKFHTPLGVVSDGGLFAYQEEEEVPVKFRLSSERSFTFELEDHDETKTLVIDPLITSLSYLGGSSYEYGLMGYGQINGNIIASGETYSADFPATPGVIDDNPDPLYGDVFLSMFNSDQSDILFSTFIGGNSQDVGEGIDIDENGNIYITGTTFSKDFPTTEGAMNETSNIRNDTDDWGNEVIYPDSFVMKISSTGNSLIYSTFLGGNDYEVASGIAIDVSGNAYVTGSTHSSDFPVRSAYNDHLSGYSDFYILKLNTDGSAAEFSTYLGGNDFWSEGEVYGIIVDGRGRAIVTGYTQSNDFPTTSGAFKTSFPSSGRSSGFITKLSASGNSLVESTFLFGDINPADILEVKDGYVVAGYTFNTALPVSSDAVDREMKGWYDGFLLKIDLTLSSLDHCTYFGGSSDMDYIVDLTLDEMSNIYVAGITGSNDMKTTPGALNNELIGEVDGFFARFQENLTSFDLLSYFGGSRGDETHWIHPFDENNILISGITESTDLPVSENAFDRTCSGYDLYAGKIKISSMPPYHPMNLSIERGDSHLNLSWDPPLHDGNETVLNYTVYMSATNMTFDEIGRVSADEDLKFTKDFLDNGQRYYFHVTATNIVGESRPSVLKSAVPARPPTMPDITSIETGNGTVSILWDIPKDMGGDRLITYNIYYGHSSSDLELTASGLDEQEHTLTGLVNGVTYYFSVSASNRMGEGEMSIIVHAVPMTTATGPRNLTAERGSNYLHLYWDEPADNGGDEGLQYSVYIKRSNVLDDLTEVDSGLTARDLNITGLENGVVYDLMVTAFNSKGEGLPSKVLTTGPIGVPDKPEGLEAEFEDSVVHLQWQPPGYTGGGEIMGYNIYMKIGNLDIEKVRGPVRQTTAHFTELENGQRYEFHVTSVNELFESIPSDSVRGVPIGPPGPPLDLTVETGDGKAFLQWSEPSYDGGSRVTSYDIFMGTSNDDLTRTTDTTLTSHTVSGLNNGVVYFFGVRASNSMSIGKISNIVSGMPITTPGQPELTYYKGGDSFIELKWRPPYPLIEAVILTYNIYIGSDKDPLHLLVEDIEGTQYTITDLENGEDYSVGISAVNFMGEGFVSETVKVMPMGPPPDPLVMSITTDGGMVEINWTLPERDGGSPIIEVLIYRWMEGEEPGLLDRVPAKTGSFRDESVEYGKDYNYMVRGRSAAGISPPSDTLTVSVEEEKEEVSMVLVAMIIITACILIMILIGSLMIITGRRDKKRSIQQQMQYQNTIPPYQGPYLPGAPANEMVRSVPEQERLGPAGQYERGSPPVDSH